MPRVRSRNDNFDKGLTAAYRDCGVSYRCSRDPVSISRIKNRWVQDGNTEPYAGSQRPSIASIREDSHSLKISVHLRNVIFVKFFDFLI
ncbi:hypothetical protein TNCV_812311 [Trichonephila clavipes]|nr:hypothetical protein TNCV_812311 [Trichonephila clavipes]